MNKQFPAKLLLFGEYTIINGSAALAMPLKKYTGRWLEKKGKGKENNDLVPFFVHLKTLPDADTKLLDEAIRKGWVFESSIPLGYGLGSSGALSAAAYDSFFVKEDKSPLDLIDLKNTLGTIESYFHGQSSGLDPLTSYTQKAILIKNGLTQIAPPFALPNALHLYDSQMSREGRPLIAHYLESIKTNKAFVKANEQLKELNGLIIDELLNSQDINETFIKISQLQFQYFKPMIPESIAKRWQKGLAEERYYMKLSGAGGGGYFLVLGDMGEGRSISIS